LAHVRDTVLDRASLQGGETLLDAGCGEGLIGFGALERGAGHVVFADISRDLLELCRDAAEGLRVADRCTFVRAPVEGLEGVAEASVDVACTRSVLIYVKDKERAFGELFRVLRAGGSRCSSRLTASAWSSSAGVLGVPGDGVSDLAPRVEAVSQSEDPDESRGHRRGADAGGARALRRLPPPAGRGGKGRLADGSRVPPSRKALAAGGPPYQPCPRDSPWMSRGLAASEPRRRQRRGYARGQVRFGHDPGTVPGAWLF
jgi:SAM-dependent methyltransferase